MIKSIETTKLLPHENLIIKMRDLLSKFTKNELIRLSKKLNLTIKNNFTKSEIIEIITKNKSESEINKKMNPTWWGRKKNNIFGWASLISLLVAIIFYFFPNKSAEIIELKHQSEEIKFDSINYFNLLFLSAQELRRNRDISIEYREFIKQENHLKPLGKYSLKKTNQFVEKYYKEFMQDSHGEEKYIYQIITTSNDLENVNFSSNFATVLFELDKIE